MIKLDAADLRILAALQGQGRISKLKLAQAAHLSPAACWERLRRLEQAGVIAGYAADIAIEKVARVTTVLVEITLRSHQHDDFARFEAAMQDEANVIECLAVGGGLDYMLRVVVPDIDAYQRLMDRLLVAEIGIDRYFTYVVTKKVKAAPLPLVLLDGVRHD
jgi:Lrp/AsnC family transcriptional regulator of ectoine degradation